MLKHITQGELVKYLISFIVGIVLAVVCIKIVSKNQAIDEGILFGLYLLGVLVFSSLVLLMFNYLTPKDNRYEIGYFPSDTNLSGLSNKYENATFENESYVYSNDLNCIYSKAYKARLLDCLLEVRRYGQINLTIGLIISAFCACVIFFYKPDDPLAIGANPYQLFYYYFSKFFAVIFAEILVFFFLRLYRQNLRDIKYFQNELSSIEARFIALSFALKKDDQKSLDFILRELGQMDRNSLKKESKPGLKGLF